MYGDGLGLYMTDVYPNYGGSDTGTSANPDVNDQEALNEDTKIAEKASVSESSGKTILLAVLVLVLLVVFLGIGG